MSDQMEQTQQMMQLLRGYMVTKSIQQIAALGVVDRMGDGATDVQALASAVGANTDALYRVMRALATVGIFHETEPRRFSLAPLGKLLRVAPNDAPSMRDLALLFGGDMYRAWNDLEHSLKTGQSAFESVFGDAHFPYLDRHPEEMRTFERAMAIGLGPRLDALFAYDWMGAEHVVDVGGGNGALLVHLLSRHEHLRGTVFERASVANAAQKLIASRSLSDRCGVVVGDFFAELPRGADIYLLSRVLHDWADSPARVILTNVAEAMARNATLLIIDDVVPPGDLPHPCKWTDLQMLAVTGGRERNESEWKSLLLSAGLSLGYVLQRGPASMLVIKSSTGAAEL